jgi:hypothetical protein
MHDIRDPGAYVHATIKRSGRFHSPDELEELHQIGMEELCKLAARFEPRRAGYEVDGRFSGFAAKFLPLKMEDRYHGLHPEHQHVAGDDGKRRWRIGDRAISLDALTDDDPDRHHVMAAKALDDDLEGRLRAALIKAAREEIPTVIDVAARTKHSDAMIAHTLGLDEETVRRHMRTIVRARPTRRHIFASKDELRQALELLADRDAARASGVGNLLGQGENDAGVAEILTQQLRAAGELEDWEAIETSEVRDHQEAIRRVWHLVEAGTQ